MARKRRPPEPENHERWMVSYADFLTLLFAFFVMMFANSRVEQKRIELISEGFQQAIDPGSLSHVLTRIMGQRKPAPKEAVRPDQPGGKKPDPNSPAEDLQTMELVPSMHQLSKVLRQEIQDGRLDVRLERRGLVVSLREATFFPPGNDAIETAAYPTLERIADGIRVLPNPIRLEGHTDSVPIHTVRFNSNWDLSAARAIAMLNLFSSKFNIDHNRMAIAGFADTAAMTSNDTPDGRARNRRVDIVILNQTGLKSEPEQAHGSPPKQ